MMGMLSTNSVELLNNTLTALVLDQLDNMGSLLFINWVRINFNQMTTQSSFMILRSAHTIENYLFSIYLFIIAGFIFMIIDVSNNMQANILYYSNFEENTGQSLQSYTIMSYFLGVIGLSFFFLLLYTSFTKCHSCSNKTNNHEQIEMR